jgi:hypothetical protein
MLTEFNLVSRPILRHSQNSVHYNEKNIVPYTSTGMYQNFGKTWLLVVKKASDLTLPILRDFWGREEGTRQAVYVKHKTEARSNSHSCLGNELLLLLFFFNYSITYSESVFVALGIQHVMRVR